RAAVSSMSDDGYSRSYRGNDPYGRGGAASSARAHDHQDDPLTELARLIGQGDQQQQADWRGAAPRAGYDGYHYPGQPADPRYNNAAAGYPAHDPYQAPGHDPQYGQQFNGQGYEGQGYAQGYGQGYEQQQFSGDAYRHQGGYDQSGYG